MSRTVGPVNVETLAERARGEFLEMPGLRLTAGQARRLWGLDEAQCEAVLLVLIESRFLVRTADGAFTRAASGPERFLNSRSARCAGENG